MQASNAAALSDQQIKNGKAAEMEYNNNPPMDGYSFGADMDSAGNGESGGISLMHVFGSG